MDIALLGLALAAEEQRRTQPREAYGVARSSLTLPEGWFPLRSLTTAN
jgi:hypothetical protein